MNEQSPPISIRFENCSSQGCQRYSAYVGVANRNGERTVRGSIEFVACRFENDAGAGGAVEASGHLLGQGLAEGIETGLDHRIRDLPGIARVADHARDVHHPPAARAEHEAADHQLREVPGAARQARDRVVVLELHG